MVATSTAGAIGIFGGLFALIIILWIAFMAIGILALIFWIFMIVDVAKRKFKNDSDRILWILVVILAGIIGALIYYFVIKRPDKH